MSNVTKHGFWLAGQSVLFPQQILLPAHNSEGCIFKSWSPVTLLHHMLSKRDGPSLLACCSLIIILKLSALSLEPIL